MLGLLNGSDRYILDRESWIRVAQVIEPSIGIKWGIVLEKRSDSSLVWSAKIDDLGSDPASGYVKSSTSDYKGFFWRRAGVFIIAGFSKLALIDNDEGVIVREDSLGFVGKGSIDVLQFILSPSERVLVVVSSLLVIAFDDTKSLRWKWEPKSLISGVAKVDSAGLTLSRYDFDSNPTALISDYLHY